MNPLDLVPQRWRPTTVLVLVASGVLLASHLVHLVLPDVLPKGLPFGIALQGIVIGALEGMLAIGLVLVYRTNRIINFAQGALGAFAGVLVSQLVTTNEWNYVPAAVAAIAAAAVVGGLMEIGIVRRFFKAPRLILTVATIGLAQLLAVFELAVPVFWGAAGQTGGRIQTPFARAISFRIEPFLFNGDYLVIVLVAVASLAGLAAFFRFSRYGIAARAAAENADRARLLGIRVKRLSTIVWIIAAVLAAVTSVLRAPVLGFSFGGVAGPALLLSALAAATIGRLESIPATFIASLALGIGKQMLFFNTQQGRYNDLLLFVVILVALLLQRKRISRVDPGLASWSQAREVRPVPRELADLREVRLMRYGLPALLLAIALVVPAFLSQSQANFLAVIAIYGIVGASLVLLTGWGGQVSLGQWALVGVGAFTVNYLDVHFEADFFVTLLLAGTIGAVVAALVGLPALRIRGLFLAATTLAFALAAQGYFFDTSFVRAGRSSQFIDRPFLFGFIDVRSDRAYYYVCLAGLVLALVMGRNLRRSRFGRILVAVRDNENASAAYGVRLTNVKIAAFAMSGFIAAFGGGLLAYSQQLISATTFPADRSVVIFTMVVIGGLASLPGAVLGAAYVRGIQFFLPAWAQFFATGGGLLFLLLAFPGGLGGLLYDWRDRYLRGVARRHDVVVPSLVADIAEEQPPPALGGTVEPVPSDEPEDESPLEERALRAGARS